jgi:hypothetical protein
LGTDGSLGFTTSPAVYFDAGASAVALDVTSGQADATLFLFLELAGFASQNRLGIYGFSETDRGVELGNRLTVFGGAASPGSSRTLQFNLATGVVTNLETGSSANIGSTFGFFISTPDQTSDGRRELFYTHQSLNADGVDHAWLFNTRDNQVAELLGADVVLAFEDLRGGGDFDFNDLVVGISNVGPIAAPEPVSFLLFGSGLALALRRHQRTRRQT